MKGAFEMMGLFFFGMMFTCLLAYAGINLAIYQQARCYQEMIIASIEHHYGYDETIEKQIEKYRGICPTCNYFVEKSDESHFEYQLFVEYPILFPVLDYHTKAKLKTYVSLKME